MTPRLVCRDDVVRVRPGTPVDRLLAAAVAGRSDDRTPWPGRVPAPAPAHVAPDPVGAELVDAAGAPVGVTGRGVATAEPARIRVGGERAPWTGVVAWAGPWPVEERWWDPARARRRARLQVVDDAGVARLLALEEGRWWVLAVYD